jgi:hypothetical protein
MTDNRDRETNPFQIRLRLKGNIPKVKSIQTSSSSQVVTIAPQMSMGELLDLAHDIFGVPKGKKYHIDLYAGFPPKKIDLTDSASSKASLVTANGILGGNAISVAIIEMQPSRQVDNSNNSNNGTNSHDVKASSRKRPLGMELAGDNLETLVRPKRAAAKVASDSFQSIIRHQDKILKEERQQGKTSPGKNQQSRGRKTSASATRAAAAHSRRMAALPGGRRLVDDENSDHSTTTGISDHHPSAMGYSSPSTRKLASSKSLFKDIQSEDDVSFALISSLESGGSKGNGKVSKILRASMRKTVAKSYEASRAAVRHSSISSGKVVFFQTTDSKEEHVNNTMGTYTVQYPKNVEGRGFYQEQVHVITIEMLKAVVQAVYDDHHEESSSREMLKPQNMALLSPRVFWSLWYHYHEKSSSIEGALEMLLPNLDWSFLYHRSRQLSEKAKENLRQENEKIEPKHVQGGNVAAGIRAVEEVENAMATMYDETVVDARQRMAEAALARLGKQSGTALDEWVLKTPMDIDEDELEECMLDSENALGSDVLKRCIDVLISKLSINNWRVLANSSTTHVCKILQDENVNIREESVDRWISSAQTRSIEEIMLEIIDGNQDLYEILSVELSSSTPRDLSLWRDVPSMIIEEASSQVTVSEHDLQKYCNRARRALNSLRWLELYSTSIGTST